MTLENKRSLVLYSPPVGTAAPVLFSSDSDLKNQRVDWRGHRMMTAPHHGSADNQPAFHKVMREHRRPGTIVQADGKWELELQVPRDVPTLEPEPLQIANSRPGRNSA